jgi:saccharopine dehydrogenase-like NADP-dependent oxidoreductase
MAKIIVLGAGMVGRAMAADLSANHRVTSVDINQDNLNLIPDKYRINKIKMDLSAFDEVGKLVSEYDLIIGAVPGFMGFRIVEAVIKAGKNIVDISFFPEDGLLLDELAKVHGVTAIIDCGVAPGMSNLILGYHASRMKVDTFKCYVGGLPFRREFPFQYKAPFSPVDVLEEYTRPARYVENGHVLTKPALSDAEFLQFEEVGTLEAFNSDGLRSILFTIQAPNMIEKTLRYPGHIEYIKVLKDAGFFSNELIRIGTAEISPMQFTSKLLFDKWKLNDDDDEFTIMRIIVEGVEDGKKVNYEYNLFDRRDKDSGFSSMARTTGFTATAAAELVLSGQYDRKGITPPEFIGESEACFNAMLEYLGHRSIKYPVTIS